MKLVTKQHWSPLTFILWTQNQWDFSQHIFFFKEKYSHIKIFKNTRVNKIWNNFDWVNCPFKTMSVGSEKCNAMVRLFIQMYSGMFKGAVDKIPFTSLEVRTFCSADSVVKAKSEINFISKSSVPRPSPFHGTLYCNWNKILYKH